MIIEIIENIINKNMKNKKELSKELVTMIGINKLQIIKKKFPKIDLILKKKIQKTIKLKVEFFFSLNWFIKDNENDSFAAIENRIKKLE